MYWITILLYAGAAAAACNEEQEAKEYLDYLNKLVCERSYYKALAKFNYNINKTDETLQKWQEEDAIPYIYPSEYKAFNWSSFNNSYLLREANFYGLLSFGTTNNYSLMVDDIIAKMSDAGEVDVVLCNYKNRSKCDADVYSDAFSAFSNSSNLDEINYYYMQFLDPGSRAVRPYYEQYINVSNELARADGFANQADSIIADFEDPPVNEFECVMEHLWEQFEPFYFQYISFIRGRFRKRFGKDVISKTGPMPAALLDIVDSRQELLPFPEKPVNSLQDILHKQNISGIKLARLVEEFYTSIGLEPLPQSFWDKSVFTKPKGVRMECIPATYDFQDKNDIRITVCSTSSESYVHEMGHCHYHLVLQQQPCCFREAPNIGMDESIANSMTLAFPSRKFLLKHGFLNATQETDDEVETNYLFQKLVTLIDTVPSALLSDLWRYNVFRGNIPANEYNKAYWDYKRKYEGGIPPEVRSEEYLDAIEISNVLVGYPVISYFIECLLQFQIFEATCIATGEFDPNNPTKKPLHKCDIYGNTEAGKVMTKLYKPGASQPWTKTLKDALGKSSLDPKGFIRYFQKLLDFFKAENKKNGEFIGWK